MEIEADFSQSDHALRTLLRGLKDATPLTTLIGADQELATDDRFKNEVDPDGSPWAALSPKYLESKRRRGLILKRNQARGETRGTISYRAYDDRVEIGANTPQAEFMQKRRPFLGVGRRDIERIERIANDYLQDLVE
jgi:phage gpG-like protein